MELDFGPAEPPSQPPKNLPPSEGNPGMGQSTSSPAPSTTPPPPPPPLPNAPQGAPVAHAASVPVKPKGKRKVLLILGILIILLGLGYLGFTVFTKQGAPTDTADLGVQTITPTIPSTAPPSDTTATATSTPSTPSTLGATSSTTATETVQTRDAIRKKDLATIQTYLESYFNEKGSYPTSPTVARLNDSTNSVVTALVPKYTSALPRDPKDPEYFYGYKSLNGKTYTLSARLENTADPEGKQEGTIYLYTVSK
ncbi:type II secretion system protein GspG [Candidatus Berkelbacteria bacterium]|nr:type II secretion system protein GspG [Candidatus Berkelbacteria bacterium]